MADEVKGRGRETRCIRCVGSDGDVPENRVWCSVVVGTEGPMRIRSGGGGRGIEYLSGTIEECEGVCI